MSHQIPLAEKQAPPPILEAAKRVKQFRVFTAANEDNLKFNSGHIHAIIGADRTSRFRTFQISTACHV